MYFFLNSKKCKKENFGEGSLPAEYLLKLETIITVEHTSKVKSNDTDIFKIKAHKNNFYVRDFWKLQYL